MRYTLTDGVLTVFFEGRIDSSNAPETEKELFELISSCEHNSTVINAEFLNYISSAGLRVLLKLRRVESVLKMTDVSPDVYEVLDMTGFSEMIPVEKAYRRFSVEGCEKIGEGSNGVVYRYNPETVIKVYRDADALDDIKRERSLARTALILGIPTAIPFDVVKVGEKYATVFELLNSRSFSEIIRTEPENTEKYIGLFVELLKQIHSTELKGEDIPSMKKRALGWAEYLKEYLPPDESGKLCSLIENTPDRHTMIHGDYHTNNVQMQNGEVLLVDMDTLSYGHPVFELATMFISFVAFGEVEPETITRYLGLPYECTERIWHRTLELYLGTEDRNRVREVEEKAKIAGYARLLRRSIRRESDTELGQSVIAICKKRLAELLPRVDTLDF